MANGKHMDLSKRIVIQTGLDNGSSKSAIANNIGMDVSSVCKEIKLHSKIKKQNNYGKSVKNGTYDCIHMDECGFNTYCTNPCEKLEIHKCNYKNKHGVCNGCESLKKCKFNKLIYNAEDAQNEYTYTLHDSRTGVDMTSSEAKQIGDILASGIKNGQSIAVILSNNSDINKCEKTIYNHINEGVYSVSGVTNISLRSKVSRKLNKKDKIKYKKREDRSYLKGRTYKDYEEYMALHPDTQVVEMDTVYNDVSNGPFIQTFQFTSYELMIGVYHTGKTAQEMYEGVKYLKDKLGDEFNKYVSVILTDRGSEFVMAKEMEELGIKVFYCDPMAGWQKPHVENNHKIFRYICPKETDLYKAGLRSQEDTNLIFSHINSYKREELHFKSPIQVLKFFNEDSAFLEKLDIKEISPEDVKLTPDLIKK